MVGTLTFIWATVVLLGGFTITMKESDFWVVTAILVIEGARLFSRNHQLELQHQDKNDCSGSLIRRTAQFFNCPGCSSCPDPSSHATASTRQGASHGKDTWATNSGLRQSKMRKWENLRVPILPWLEIRASNVLLLLELVQVLAALATLAMSIARLRMQQFTLPKEKEDGTQINHRSALFIFYSLAITEALVFLIQRLYWEINIYYRHVLERLNKSLGLKPEDLPMTRSFFYQVYSTCLSQSIYGSLVDGHGGLCSLMATLIQQSAADLLLMIVKSSQQIIKVTTRMGHALLKQNNLNQLMDALRQAAR